MFKHLSLSLVVVGLFSSLTLSALDNDSLAFVRTPSDVKSFQVSHIAYTLSYNYDYNIPNWVSYCLTRYEVENKKVNRKNNFRPDPDVPNSPTKSDYSKSGYSRGHMAPSADMRWDGVVQSECFYMSNMCPQSNNLNSGCWSTLEEQVRTLARRYDSVYVCCGPVLYEPYSSDTYIGTARKILVPGAFYKVLLAKINGEWNAIGFLFSHENRSGKVDLRQFSFSIDEVERITGFDFFYNLPDDIENRVESTFNYDLWK